MPWPKFRFWIELIRWHFDRHPGFSVQDMYKLIYQGVLGAEHLLMEPKEARERLEAEWQAQPTEAAEPPVEPVSLNCYYVRLNIRPCKALGLTSAQIWQLFLHAAQKRQAHHADFVALWREIISNHSFPFPTAHVRTFDDHMSSKGYPPCHHSKTYNEANKPSYRIALGDEVVTYIKTLIKNGNRTL